LAMTATTAAITFAISTATANQRNLLLASTAGGYSISCRLKPGNFLRLCV
jgi:hypothetical protein